MRGAPKPLLQLDANPLDLRLELEPRASARRAPVGPGSGGGPIIRTGGGGGGGGGGRGGGGGGGNDDDWRPGRTAPLQRGPVTQVDNVLNAVNYSSYSGVLTSRVLPLPSSTQAPRRIEVGTRLGF